MSYSQYMNLNEAAVLRDQIDDILTQDTGPKVLNLQN